MFLLGPVALLLSIARAEEPIKFVDVADRITPHLDSYVNQVVLKYLHGSDEEPLNPTTEARRSEEHYRAMLTSNQLMHLQPNDRELGKLRPATLDDLEKIFQASLATALSHLSHYSTPKLKSIVDDVHSEPGRSDTNNSIRISIEGVDFKLFVPDQLLELSSFIAKINDIDFERLKRFLVLQADVLPIIHDYIPGIHYATLSALNAIKVLNPESGFAISVIPALVEFLSSAMIVQNSSEPIAVVLNLFIREMLSISDTIRDTFRSMEGTFLLETLISLMGESNYANSTIERLRLAISDLLPELSTVYNIYKEEVPALSTALRTMFDISTDMNTSLKDVIQAFEQHDVMTGNADDAQQLLPLVLTNFARLARRGGLMNHQKDLHEAVKSMQRLVKTVLSINGEKIDELINSLTAFSLRVPRAPGILVTLDNMLIDTSVVISHVSKRLLFSIDRVVTHLYEISKPTMAPTELIHSVGPLLNLLSVELPEFTVATTLVCPFLHSARDTTLYIIKIIEFLIAQQRCVQTCGLGIDLQSNETNCVFSLLSKAAITVNQLFRPLT